MLTYTQPSDDNLAVSVRQVRKRQIGDANRYGIPAKFAAGNGKARFPGNLQLTDRDDQFRQYRRRLATLGVEPVERIDGGLEFLGAVAGGRRVEFRLGLYQQQIVACRVCASPADEIDNLGGAGCIMLDQPVINDAFQA